MPTTWPEYLVLQGYTDTAGQHHDPVTGLMVPTLSGKYRPGFPLAPSIPGSQPGRYGQPDDAGPYHEEASFVDPGVLDEFAHDKGLDMVRANDSDREDIRWVTQPGSSVTFYAGVLRPYLMDRKPTPKPADLSALEARVDAVVADAAANFNALDRRLAALESKGKKG